MLLTLVPTVALADTTYDVTVCGKQVTNANMNDVLGDADDGATVVYTPAEKTEGNAKLTLKDAKLNKFINYFGDETLDIEVIGENTITLPNDSMSGIVTWRVNGDNTNASLNIYGSGTLTVVFNDTIATQNNGIFANNNLTIKDITLEVTTGNVNEYNRGLRAGNDLTIDGAKVSAITATSTSKSTNALYASHDVIIKNGADVTAVAGNSQSTAVGEGSVAIYATHDVKISGDKTKVNATAKVGLNSCGISAKNAVEISGGTVTATAGTADATYGASVGILAPKSVTINGGKVTAQAGSGALTAAIAATADGVNFGKLIVGAEKNVAEISGAKDNLENVITEGNGVIKSGAIIQQDAKKPVVIDFASRNSIVTLLAVAVSTTIAVRAITGAAKLVIGVPVALGILSRLVFRWF